MLPISIEKLHSIYKSCNNSVCTDTRNIIPGSVFFCLKGANFNGNKFAHEALSKGAAYIVADEPEVITDDRILYTGDVLQTLQELAAYHRNSIPTKILAIGGSNGKTTTKELCNMVLGAEKNVTATRGNLNNHIGVPLTLLELTGAEDIAIIELGTNHPGEMKLLCDLVKADIGLVTNVGKEHLEGFGNIEAVAREESELYLSLMETNGLALVNADDTWLGNMAKRLKNKFVYGLQSVADLQGTVVNAMPFLRFNLQYKGQTYGPYTSQLGGEYNLYNILGAISAGIQSGLDIENCAENACKYKPSNNRSEWIEKNGKTILLDAYNANPSSMEAALKSFAGIEGNKSVLLGDMLELGSFSEAEHTEILNLAVSLGFDHILVSGSEFGKAAVKDEHLHYFENTDSLVAWLQQHPLPSEYVMIKGSRGMKMEKTLDHL